LLKYGKIEDIQAQEVDNVLSFSSWVCLTIKRDATLVSW
jgi:hypothetical protein